MKDQITNWRKATASDGGGNCVEAGWTASSYGVRDTKQGHLGEGAERPTLMVSRTAGAAFVAMARGLAD